MLRLDSSSPGLPALRHHLVAPLVACGLAFVALGCPQGAEPRIVPVTPQTSRVNQKLTVRIRVENGTLNLTWEGPRTLRGVDSQARLTPTPFGAEFEYTPLASHLAANGAEAIHDFTIIGNGSKRMTFQVTVQPALEAAPVFVALPESKPVFIDRDPVVAFAIEVRDDDSPDVAIAISDLPSGAALRRDSGHRALFEWRPDSTQSTQRVWRMSVSASDGMHSTQRTLDVLLLRTEKPNCPGQPPQIQVQSPTNGATVTGATFDVTARITDDNPLRTPAQLLYATTEPTNLAMPDLTTFQGKPFERVTGSDSDYRARITSLALERGQQQRVWFVISITDADDPTGKCLHTTTTTVTTFTAIGGEGTRLDSCESCSRSIDCAGTCIATTSGSRCLPNCQSDSGTCARGTCSQQTNAEGSRVNACGDYAAVCTTTVACAADRFEANESIAAAKTPPTGSQSLMASICRDDLDFFQLVVEPNTELTVTLDSRFSDGDLDLFLDDGGGTRLAASRGTSDREELTYCSTQSQGLFASVTGYLGSTGAYTLRWSTRASDCCANDDSEPDSLSSPVRIDANFGGTICTGDEDFRRFTITSEARVRVLMAPASADLDIDLLSPTNEIIVRGRLAGTMTEDVTETLRPGTYTLKIYPGVDGATGGYTGTIDIDSSTSTCRSTGDCASTSEVCKSDGCRDATCGSDGDCPPSHFCPAAPRSDTRVCVLRCTADGECRSGERCKWFAEGRACGVAGSVAPGLACDASADCSGQTSCAAGGYCARVGCAGPEDCEPITSCVPVSSGPRVCATDCTEGTCSSPGLSCRTVGTVSVCIP